MNTYVVKIGSETYQTQVKRKKTDAAVYRYVSANLQRSKQISIQQLAYQYFDDKHDKCPFCNESTAKNINYNVDNKSMVIEITGVSFHETKGKSNYHCRRGKNSDCPGSKLNPNSIDYISTALKISREEANKLILETNKSPFYKTNHSTEAEYKLAQKRDLYWYQQKYGKERGKVLFESRNKTLSYKNSFSGLKERYGEEIAKEISSKKVSCSLEVHINRYGVEEGVKSYKRHLEKSRQTLENFIERYGEEEGNSRYLQFLEKNSFKNSLEYYIKEYGEKEGLEKYDKWRKKLGTNKEKWIEKFGEESWYNRIKKQHNKSYSNESKEAFEILLKTLNKSFELTNIKYAEDEYYLYDKVQRKIYFYDLYFRIGDDKYIIEYDTPFMHPNKNHMHIDEYNNWVNPWDKDMTPEDKENFDIHKRNFAESNGIKVFTFFVSKTNDTQENINLVEKYLKNKYGIK